MVVAMLLHNLAAAVPVSPSETATSVKIVPRKVEIKYLKTF
jgi:hypothetical protein